MGRYFGTDGFRGEANKNLTVEHAYKVGRFIGWYYHQMTGKKCKNCDTWNMVEDFMGAKDYEYFCCNECRYEYETGKPGEELDNKVYLKTAIED